MISRLVYRDNVASKGIAQSFLNWVRQQARLTHRITPVIRPLARCYDVINFFKGLPEGFGFNPVHIRRQLFHVSLATLFGPQQPRLLHRISRVDHLACFRWVPLADIEDSN
jgi:hypothetical protein